MFQACNYNLDDVVDEFFAKLDVEVERHRELIDTLPRLRGVFSRDNAFIHVSVLWEPLDGWQPMCRFRQSEDESDRLALSAW